MTNIKYLAIELALAWGNHIGNIYKRKEDRIGKVQDLPEYKEFISKLEELDNA
jgi:hypothetical protein